VSTKNNLGYRFGKAVDDLLHVFYTTKDHKEAEEALRHVKPHFTSFEEVSRISAGRKLPAWKETLLSNVMDDLLMQS
jgi:hypothetical protein